MGAAWSSYRLKRKGRASYKKTTRNELREAEEYIEQFREQQRVAVELVREQGSFSYPSCVTHTKQGEANTAEMEEENRALKEKLQRKEKAVAFLRERCRKLEKNLSLLLQSEGQLHKQTALGKERLSELRLKIEASQFAGYEGPHLIELWTVVSLPDLYIVIATHRK